MNYIEVVYFIDYVFLLDFLGDLHDLGALYLLLQGWFEVLMPRWRKYVK